MEQQVFLVLDVVVKRAFGDVQVLGDLVQRGAVEALFVEKPGAGLEKGFLLESILFLAVETLTARPSPLP